MKLFLILLHSMPWIFPQFTIKKSSSPKCFIYLNSKQFIVSPEFNNIHLNIKLAYIYYLLFNKYCILHGCEIREPAVLQVTLKNTDSELVIYLQKKFTDIWDHLDLLPAECLYLNLVIPYIPMF